MVDPSLAGATASCKAEFDARGAEPSSASDSPTVGEILRRYGAAYVAKFGGKMSRDQHRAMQMIQRCRTGKLGSVRYYCSDCNRHHWVLRSCGNRHCPACQSQKARDWLEAQTKKLLPCEYFLLTFTVPSKLRRIVRSYPKECLPVLFEAARDTLRELAANPKYIGSARLGMTGVLHTWGRTMSYHPHTHFIVPGGALSDDGTAWHSSDKKFLVPVKAASVMFRAKFREAMKACGLHDKIPPEVWKSKWVVNCKAVGDGSKALRYLAGYVYRVAITDRRIVSITQQSHERDSLYDMVTYHYRPGGSKEYKTLKVTAEEFIRRFLQHVLPRGLQKVRHYGFLHSGSRTDYELLAWIVTVSRNLVYVLTFRQQLQKAKSRPKCPDCGAELGPGVFEPYRPTRPMTIDTS